MYLGLYRFLKTWFVMKLKNSFSQLGKSWKFSVMLDRLDIADVKAWTM